MATTAVDLVVKTRGQQSLEKLANSFKKTETALEKLKGSLDGKLNAAFKRAGAAGQAAGRKIGNGFKRAAQGAEALSKRLGGLRGQLAGLGVGAGLTKAFFDASAADAASSRIERLEERFGRLRGLQDLATQSAEKFRLTQTQAISELTDLGNRLGPQGRTLKELSTIYDGFNTLLVNNKVEAAQAASAQLQLNQALGSGRLAGEEFNAINEATPQLLDEVARVIGVNRGELKQLAADGEITSDILITALGRIAKDGASELEKSFGGAFGATREFNVALQEFSKTVGEELLPAITPLLQEATKLLKLFGDLPQPARTTAVAITALGAAAVLAAPLVGGLLKFVTLFAPAAVAAGAGAKTFAGGLALLKGALIALPFAALVALLGATAVAFKQSADRAQELTDKLGSDKLADVESGIAQLRDRQEELNAQLEKLQNSDYYRGLQADIQDIKREIADVDERIDNATRRRQLIIDVQILNDSIPKIKGFDTLTDSQLDEALRLAGVGNTPAKSATKKRGGGGRAAKPQDDTKAAEDELRRLVQGNNLLLERNELEKALLQNQYDYEDTLKRIKEFQNISPELREQLELAAKTLATNKSNALVLDSVFEATAAATQAAIDAIRPLEDQRKLLEAKLNGTEKQARLEIEIAQEIRGKNADLAEEIELRMRANAALQDQLDATVKLDNLYEGIGNTIQTGIIDAITTGIEGLVNGVEDLDKALQEIAQGVLADIGRQLISFGINSVLSSLGGNDGVGLFSKLFPQRATGGPVIGGQPYIIGERGPELMVPNQSGTVIPNEQMSAAMARYSRSGNGPNAVNADGSMGGGDYATTVTYNGPTLTFNGDDYLPKSAVPEIINAAAKRGAAAGTARTMSNLKNNRSTRSKLGM